MNNINIAVLPGDGIGIEVIHAAVPIFKALEIPVELHFSDVGWSCWTKAGEPIPARTWKLIENSDATLLGATTSKPEREAIQALPINLQQNPPKYVSPIVQLRQKLDLFADVRPCFNIKGTGPDFRFTVVRENTEGLYAGLDYYPLSNALPLISLRE